jgi:hypothetical protein
VDFILYGVRGLAAIEVKMSHHVRSDDLRGLRRFKADYPRATAFLLHTGSRRRHDAGMEIEPAEAAVRGLDRMIA